MKEWPQVLRKSILDLFPKIKSMASNTTCKRKGVGCAILEFDITDDTYLMTVYHAVNGHSGDGTGNKCQNIVGGCGCAHAEPRAIMEYLKLNTFGSKLKKENVRTILLSTYSACVNCANIIVDSGIINAVAYEIHAEYWDTHPRNASKIIEASLPHWTMELIENDGIFVLEDWLAK